MLRETITPEVVASILNRNSRYALGHKINLQIPEVAACKLGTVFVDQAGADMSIKIEFTRQELDELINALAETAMQMDDDGREGAFAASPLKPIYDKLRASLHRNLRP